MISSLIGAVELGLLYALLALGVYITYRILDFPDLTVDGSFTTGGGIAAVMISHGYNAWLSCIVAFAEAASRQGYARGCSIPKEKSTGCCPGY